jgi:hypothetical protein
VYVPAAACVYVSVSVCAALLWAAMETSFFCTEVRLGSVAGLTVDPPLTRGAAVVSGVPV